MCKNKAISSMLLANTEAFSNHPVVMPGAQGTTAMNLPSEIVQGPRSRVHVYRIFVFDSFMPRAKRQQHGGLLAAVAKRFGLAPARRAPARHAPASASSARKRVICKSQPARSSKRRKVQKSQLDDDVTEAHASGSDRAVGNADETTAQHLVKHPGGFAKWKHCARCRQPGC